MDTESNGPSSSYRGRGNRGWGSDRGRGNAGGRNYSSGRSYYDQENYGPQVTNDNRALLTICSMQSLMKRVPSAIYTMIWVCKESSEEPFNKE